MEWSTSSIERVISKPRPLWLRIVVSLGFLLLPFAFAYFDGVLNSFLRQDHWRVYVLPPTIILYIWFVSAMMSRSEYEVIRSIKPLVPMADEDFDRMVQQESHVNPRYEWLVIAIGVVGGLFIARESGIEAERSWLSYYWYISLASMYGLLAWVTLGAAISTRLNNAFHQQQLRIDILDLTPFQAIGRQSLLLALVFIGGVTLSYLITIRSQDISSPSFWWRYLLMISVILLIFFISMRSTQKLIANAKKQELKPLQQRINHDCRELMKRLEKDQDPGSIPDRINALTAYELRVLAARTWPYNTDMLRTLIFSVLIPLGSVIARLLIEIFLR